MKNKRFTAQLAKFVLVACGTSWLLWLSIILLQANPMKSPLILMPLLGLYIPAATTIIYTARSHRHRPLRDLLQLLINPRLIRPGGYA